MALDVPPRNTEPDETPPPQRLGQLVPAVVAALAILVVLAVRGTANPPSPLAIFTSVALVVAALIAAVATIPDNPRWKVSGSTRMSAWHVAVRTSYLALVAAGLYVVQEIVVVRLGGDAAAQADTLLALELLALLLVALFVARPVSSGGPFRFGVPSWRSGRGGNGGTSLENARGVLYGLMTALAVVALALVAFAIQPGRTGLAAIGTGLAVSGGAVAFGALLGLLFGIPRSLQRARPDGEESGAPVTTGYRANTNLEEISDWLTKIIVGVSLTQLGEIQTQVVGLVSGIADGFGGTVEARAFVAGLLTLAVIAGFLSGYLLARLYLPRALLEADRTETVRIATEAATAAATEQATVVAKKEASEVAASAAASNEDQIRKDAEANRVATLQLDAASPEVPEGELAAALTAASQTLRDVVFQRASQQRSQFWRGNNLGDKLKMERTIPVFRALIKADPDREHHYRGQLGFSLKDQSNPDYAGSIEELSRAIEIRDTRGETGGLFFEFNRAMAGILSGAGDPERIMADLCKAAESELIRGIIEVDKDVVAWLQQQGIEPAALRERCGDSKTTSAVAPEDGGGTGAGGTGAGGTDGESAPDQEAAGAAARAAELAAQSEVKATQAADAAAKTSDAADAAAAAANDPEKSD